MAYNDPAVISQIQIKLADIGMLDPPADGVFGPLTRWAMEVVTGDKFDGDAVVTDAQVAKIMATSPLPMDLSGNDFATWILKAMVARRVWIARYPDCVNIAYVEGCNTDGTPNANRPNCFDAARTLVRINRAGKPELLGAWEATTTASRHWTEEPMNPNGAARIALGQQKSWSWGDYHGDALTQARNLTITRDPKKTYTRYGPSYTGMYGIHHHRGYNYPRNDEGLSSAGCQVGRTNAGHAEFMSILATDKRQKLNGHYLWFSTVMEYAEIAAVKSVVVTPSPVPPVPEPPVPPVVGDLTKQIQELAKSSPAAAYSWHGRGMAPVGYIEGMAVCYGIAYQRFKSDLPIYKDMAKDPHGGTYNTDALNYYQLFAPPGAPTLNNLWTLLIGLGMRESSGSFCEGRDRSAENTSSDTAEAGAFQQSWNSHVATPAIRALLEQYKRQPGNSWVTFHKGVHCSTAGLENYGSGDGYDFQKLCKDCPEFSAMAAAIGLRYIRGHWGPINRKEAEVRNEVRVLLTQVQGLVDQSTETLQF